MTRKAEPAGKSGRRVIVHMFRADKIDLPGQTNA